MSAIHDLIAQVSDPRLRQRLTAEWANAAKQKKFGLVFEDHLPELLPLHGAKPRKGDLVCRKNGPLKDVLQVKSIYAGMATCVKPSNETKPSEPTRATAEQVQLAVEELLVVREFGEPIFPALVPVDAVANGPADAPWHTLIEADNYHALQLLDYLYAGQVDCIYIDPPYNTGARDWKYNNDYVDSNDSWRHSKWLAFMEKRLRLAKRLLKPDTGVLIVTIDQNEAHHLALLIEQAFPSYERTMVTIVIHGRGNAGTNFDRVEEFAFFVMPSEKKTISQRTLDSYCSINATKGLISDTRTFVRTGNNSTPDRRRGMFYPIWVNKKTGSLRIGDVTELDQSRHIKAQHDEVPVWPTDERGADRVWRHNPVGAGKALAEGLLNARYDEINLRWRVRLTNFKTSSINHRTVWQDSSHAAKNHGTSLLTDILGGEKFSFPKSLYAVRDCIAAVTAANKGALVLDFFAGSGTTLNAINLLNATDGGTRRCILVTNNEVSAEKSALLTAEGLQPGDEDWERHGICRSVTWPRSKYTILGQRDDGTVLPGEYLTGKTVEREKSRNFTQIGFCEPANLSTLAKKKQVVGLIDGLPQTLVQADSAFVVSEEHKASVLFDPTDAEAWLEALDGQDHITDFYIVAPVKRVFDEIKTQVVDLLGPLLVPEEEKRPMSQGFAANLAYFKLDFLEKDNIPLRRAFKELLPLLWLKAGAIGPRPALKRNEPEPPFLAPEGNNFAVLLDESRLRGLLKHLSDRTGLVQVYIVTDSDEAFKSMAREVRLELSKHNPDVQVAQLYRDYLLNFMINTHQDRAAGASSEGRTKS